MPSFWAEGIGNAFLLSKNHCECLSFWPKGIANAFLFTLNGNFSLTIGMIMPLGWAKVTGIIPKLVTQGPFGFATRHLWLRHLWLMGNPNGLSWLVLELFFPFMSGLPCWCLRLSLKASRQCSHHSSPNLLPLLHIGWSLWNNCFLCFHQSSQLLLKMKKDYKSR